MRTCHYISADEVLRERDVLEQQTTCWACEGSLAGIQVTSVLYRSSIYTYIYIYIFFLRIFNSTNSTMILGSQEAQLRVRCSA